MHQARLEEIELKTRDLITDILGDPDKIEPPINLGEILQNFNLSLSIASFKLPNVSGAYDNSQQTIFIAKTDSPKRQLFTVAHELGHLILNHDRPTDIFYRHQALEFNNQDLTEEKEANFFAAALLMPKELVEKFWQHHSDIELLAAFFGVSRTAAFWRLKNLKKI